MRGTDAISKGYVLHSARGGQKEGDRRKGGGTSVGKKRGLFIARRNVVTGAVKEMAATTSGKQSDKGKSTMMTGERRRPKADTRTKKGHEAQNGSQAGRSKGD